VSLALLADLASSANPLLGEAIELIRDVIEHLGFMRPAECLCQLPTSRRLFEKRPRLPHVKTTNPGPAFIRNGVEVDTVDSRP